MYWDCLYLPLYIWMDIQGGCEVRLGHHPGFEEKVSSLQPYSDNMPSQLPPVCSWSTQIFLSKVQPTHLNKGREERKKGTALWKQVIPKCSTLLGSSAKSYSARQLMLGRYHPSNKGGQSVYFNCCTHS